MTADEPGTTGSVRTGASPRREPPKPAWWRRALVWALERWLPKDVDKKLGGG